MLRYDSFTKTEALLSPTGLTTLVNVSYDAAGHATHYDPMHPMQPASVFYNHWGHVVKRQHGNIVELYEYDNLLRQNAIFYGDNTTLKFIFKDRSSKVRFPSVKTSVDLIVYCLFVFGSNLKITLLAIRYAATFKRLVSSSIPKL